MLNINYKKVNVNWFCVNIRGQIMHLAKLTHYFYVSMCIHYHLSAVWSESSIQP